MAPHIETQNSFTLTLLSTNRVFKPWTSRVLTSHVMYIYTVTCIPIARQQLGKHVPTKRMRVRDGHPMLGNESVNMPPYK
jgi:hypothetical protein